MEGTFQFFILIIIILNIRSLPKHFDHFQELLFFYCSMEIRFQIIALTETRLVADSPIPHNLDINGYTLISNSTEASAGGTAIYVCNSLSYRYREDLSTKMYHSKQLEPNFIEILGQEKKYGCRHPGMSINDFTKLYFSSISGNIKKEKKLSY